MLSFFILLPVWHFILRAILVSAALEPDWLFKYREVCDNGGRQSPIDIAASAIPIDNDAKTFVTLVNYNTIIPKYSEVTDQFNGTVILYHDGLPRRVSAIVRRDDDSTSEYDLHSLHFRWRCTEHAFDGQHYALEAQFLHYNREYGNLPGAITEKDGLLGIAVLFKMENSDDVNNRAIDGVFDIVKRAPTLVRWSDLLSADGSLEYYDLYHYDGSITLKPCLETVAWYVLSNLNYVSQRQIEDFQSIHSPSVTHNCRPTQSLNGRQVYRVRGGLGIETGTF
jgi:carbonic anhydrase